MSLSVHSLLAVESTAGRQGHVNFYFSQPPPDAAMH